MTLNIISKTNRNDQIQTTHRRANMQHQTKQLAAIPSIIDNKIKPKKHSKKGHIMAALALLFPLAAAAFDSGSTDADGAFNPLVSTELALPEDGVFNFSSVTIPAGVTVTFKKNTTNTPVTILASGDITIDGNIYLIGGNATNTGAIGDGNIGDDGLPGVGAPGGFDGGVGGTTPNGLGGAGLGPGGGQGGKPYNSDRCGGGGGGFAGGGGKPYGGCKTVVGGVAYGSVRLLPLIGGSGGGGGMAGAQFAGSGGGGGGGAILLASSGTVTVNGRIYAYGGLPGKTSTTQYVNGSGGAGSGGAIRIVANTIAGNGQLNAVGRNEIGGGRYTYGHYLEGGGNGAAGRIRLESDAFLRTAVTTPAYSFDAPSAVFVAGLPKLVISSVAGVDAPAVPTGNADIVLPEDTANPVAVVFAASGIPVGNTVALTLTPPHGAPIKAVSDALAGTEASSTATTSIALPDGPSVLMASVSFTVTEQQSIAFSVFTEGEKVASVSVSVQPGKGAMTTFTTVSGKEYAIPSNVAAM
jgi:hypothetical protein